MPRRRTSIKKQRVDKKRRLRNLRIKRELKESLKNFQSLLLEKKKEEAKALLKKIYAQLDKAAKKKIMHSNTASRRKSRLTLKLNRGA